MYDNKVLPDMAGIRPDSTISLVQFDPVKEMEILRVRNGKALLFFLLGESPCVWLLVWRGESSLELEVYPLPLVMSPLWIDRFRHAAFVVIDMFG